MIVRILGEGQYEVPDGDAPTLEELDARLVTAMDAGDEPAFAAALAGLIAEVRRAGTPLPEDAFAPSDQVVPFADADITETRQLLAEADGGADDGPAAGGA